MTPAVAFQRGGVPDPPWRAPLSNGTSPSLSAPPVTGHDVWFTCSRKTMVMQQAGPCGPPWPLHCNRLYLIESRFEVQACEAQRITSLARPERGEPHRLADIHSLPARLEAEQLRGQLLDVLYNPSAQKTIAHYEGRCAEAQMPPRDEEVKLAPWLGSREESAHDHPSSMRSVWPGCPPMRLIAKVKTVVSATIPVVDKNDRNLVADKGLAELQAVLRVMAFRKAEVRLPHPLPITPPQRVHGAVSFPPQAPHRETLTSSHGADASQQLTRCPPQPGTTPHLQGGIPCKRAQLLCFGAAGALLRLLGARVQRRHAASCGLPLTLRKALHLLLHLLHGLCLPLGTCSHDSAEHTRKWLPSRCRTGFVKLHDATHPVHRAGADEAMAGAPPQVLGHALEGPLGVCVELVEVLELVVPAEGPVLLSKEVMSFKPSGECRWCTSRTRPCRPCV